MTTQFIDTLKEMFNDLENMDLDKVQKLSRETATFFTGLQGKLTSGDTDAFEEAEAATLEIKKFLEAQMGKIVEASGLTPQQLATVAQNAELSDEDQNVLAELKKGLNDQKEVHNKNLLKTRYLNT